MADPRPPDLASPFVAEQSLAVRRQRSGRLRALDVAMGRGRHALVLARQGFDVYGVDRDLGAVTAALTLGRGEGLTIRAWSADLRTYPLPCGAFDLVVVARYLQRDLFPSLVSTLAPGGVVVYETFTETQRALGRGPTSPDHLLVPNELRERFAGLDVVMYEEVAEPDALARLVARRP